MEVFSVFGGDAPIGTNSTFELRRRHVTRELEQLLLALRFGDPCQRPDLRVRQLTAREGLMDQRQLDEAARNPDVLPSQLQVPA